MVECQLNPDGAARYVSGEMAEPERSTFEDHFLACDACFRGVESLQQAAALLAAEDEVSNSSYIPPARRLPYKWMAMAATLVVAVVVWNMTDDDALAPLAPAVSAPESRPVAAPVAGTVTPPNVLAPGSAPAPAPEDTLDRWASISPPQYVPLTTRSAQSAADQATQTFNEAMAHYSAGRYREAADGLGALAEQSPDAAHVHFFLGISELMRNNVKRARGALQRSADSGVSPYADEAHFYLAKAAIKAGDLATATRELRIAVDRDAGPDGDAAKLLEEVRSAAK